MPKRPARPKPAPDAPAGAAYPAPTKAARPRRVSESATYNLYEAKTQLSELVDRAAGGEVIVIAKAGTPMARLTPIPPPERAPLRKPGGWKGKMWIADDFDDPLPPEIQMYFDDPPIFPEEWEAMRQREREILEQRERERRVPPDGKA